MQFLFLYLGCHKNIIGELSFTVKRGGASIIPLYNNLIYLFYSIYKHFKLDSRFRTYYK